MKGKMMRLLWMILAFFAAGISLYAENLVKNAGFEEGAAYWQDLGPTGQIVQGAGRDGSAALRISRQSLEEPRPVVKQENIQLIPGRRYRIGGWIKCDGVPTSADRDPAKPLISVECWRDGNYGGIVGTWVGPVAPQEWTWFETEYTAGAPAAYQVTLFGASVTICGTWYYDDIVVEELPGEWAIGQMFPMHNRVKPEGGKVLFHSFFGDIEYEYQRVEAVLLQDGAEMVCWDSMLSDPHTLTLIFPSLPEGDYELAAVLYDDRSCDELASQTLPVTVTEQTSLVEVNQDWTVSTDGKKFLPIGAYCGNVTREVVDEMKYAGFNCALTYNTIWSAVDEKSVNTLAGVMSSMDYCAENDFKLALSIIMFNPSKDNISSWDGVDGNDEIIAYLVRNLSSHPALLAWYIADEPTNDYLPWCTRAYDLIKANDPNHPVLTVFNVVSNLPKFTGCNDVFGYDEYPITRNSSLGNAAAAGEQLNTSNVPFWWVGQIMSWGSYRKPLQDYRYPTEEEMLAQNLLAFINNAKGIMNYSMFDVVEPGEEHLRASRLEELRRVNLASQELADYVLSDAEVPEYMVEVQEGTLKHRLFSNGAGEYRLLLVSPFAGATQASVTLPWGLEFAGSVRNAVRQEADGSLTFTGKDVTCDIVTLVAAP